MSCVVYTRLFTNQISDTTVRTTVLNLVWTPNDKLNWFARNTTDGEGHSTKSKYCISNAKRMMGCVKKILHLVSHRRIQLDQLTTATGGPDVVVDNHPSVELPDTTTSVLQNAHRTKFIGNRHCTYYCAGAWMPAAETCWLILLAATIWCLVCNSC